MRIISFIAILLILSSCTKEVEIDIPGYEEQIVIDGRIETGLPPVVLISRSKEVYSPTNLDAFISGFVSGATVTVSDGTNTVVLDEICSDNLPPGTEEIASAILGIPVDQLQNYSICAYTTLDASIWGQMGKTYSLTVEVEGETFTSQTEILNPTALTDLWWQPEPGLTEHGYSWATLADPPGQFDSYFWEVKRLNGESSDMNFTPTYSPVIDDEFFDGLTFDFWYENPYGGDYHDSIAYMFNRGDTVIIKISKLDRPAYEFFEKKYIQLQTAGNPFATPTNIPTNISGNALGVWAGFSPSFDTIICQ